MNMLTNANLWKTLYKGI